jgi:lipopolysaccharide export system ATP-binding protein
LNLLEVSNLTKRYGDRTVVDRVGFALGQRQIVGLLGRNGAGKTTTFRMILGMVRPDAGTVVFDGQTITRRPMYKRARLGIGYLSQERSDFRRLSVWDNLMAILETLRISRAERKRRAEEMLRQYDLVKVKGQMAGLLSGGERRKLEIARALLTSPKLILLDEPFAAVDPIFKQEIQREIRRLRDEFVDDQDFPGGSFCRHHPRVVLEPEQVVLAQVHEHGLLLFLSRRRREASGSR